MAQEAHRDSHHDRRWPDRLSIRVVQPHGNLFRDRRSSSKIRSDPELVLGAPLIAEVPSFRQEGIRTQVPVLTAPRSASAEAFRFAVSGLHSKQVIDNVMAEHGWSFAVMSAKVGEGKTVIAVNTALAVARAGGCSCRGAALRV